MKVWEPGHVYSLQSLDGGDHELLKFVKREGPGFPGNVGSHPGTIIQDVLRACIDRLDYVDKQIPCDENRSARNHLQAAMWYLERRAARRHNRKLAAETEGYIETLPPCKKCGHVQCELH